MSRTHLSTPILENVLSFFRLMKPEDQEAFLYIWDSWVRIHADMRKRLYEIDAASALSTLGPFRNALNVPFVLDPDEAVYRRALAFGRIERSSLPVPGSNQITLPDDGYVVVEPREGDTFLLAAGAEHNTADFEISGVDGNLLTTLQAFSSEPQPTLDYRVDRGELPDPIFVGCAEVYAIDPTIKSVPQLSTTVGPKGYTLIEGADYVVHEGHIGFYSRTPRQHERSASFFFAPKVIADEDRPFKNFGFPIGFKRESSEQYVRGLQALWFALWNGPTVQNIEVGTAALFGLPFTTPGVVQSVVARPSGGWEVTVEGNERVTHILPAGFPPRVSAGEEVGFEALTDGARVVDYLNDPDFIELFNLQPRIAKFHTLFVIVSYDVLQDIQAATGSEIDFETVVGFIERIKQKRVDFYLLIELIIPEELGVSADPPLIDGVVRGHALAGANFANLMAIDDFGSPGLAYPHGYRDNYELESALSGTVLSFRDSGDELTVEWDEGAAYETPDDGALVGAFVLELANSIRIQGSFSPGVWGGGSSITLATASFDHAKVKTGDVLILTGSVVALNQEAFTILSKAVGATTFTLTFDREAVAEDGLDFKVYRFYAPFSNEGDKIILNPATLVLDGLDPDTPGTFNVWRWRRGGIAMQADYEAQADTGRFDFSKRANRMVFDFDGDAMKLIDRVRITVLDQDGGIVQEYDQADDYGPLPSVTTPVPTTEAPTTAVPTTP